MHTDGSWGSLPWKFPSILERSAPLYSLVWKMLSRGGGGDHQYNPSRIFLVPKESGAWCLVLGCPASVCSWKCFTFKMMSSVTASSGKLASDIGLKGWLSSHSNSHLFQTIFEVFCTWVAFSVVLYPFVFYRSQDIPCPVPFNGMPHTPRHLHLSLLGQLSYFWILIHTLESLNFLKPCAVWGFISFLKFCLIPAQTGIS